MSAFHAPYWVPDYRCGACGNVIYVRHPSQPAANTGLPVLVAEGTCLSRHCPQRDVKMYIGLPVVEKLQDAPPLPPD